MNSLQRSIVLVALTCTTATGIVITKQESVLASPCDQDFWSRVECPLDPTNPSTNVSPTLTITEPIPLLQPVKINVSPTFTITEPIPLPQQPVKIRFSDGQLLIRQGSHVRSIPLPSNFLTRPRP